jgi:hypothetical protein
MKSAQTKADPGNALVSMERTGGHLPEKSWIAVPSAQFPTFFQVDARI